MYHRILVVHEFVYKLEISLHPVFLESVFPQRHDQSKLAYEILETEKTAKEEADAEPSWAEFERLEVFLLGLGICELSVESWDVDFRLLVRQLLIHFQQKYRILN
jgi:hypothetical protein